MPPVIRTWNSLLVLLAKMASPMTGSPSGSATFVVDSPIRVYKDIWPSPCVEEQLQCEQEVGPDVRCSQDGGSTIVGHVPRRISPVFCFY